MKTRPFAGSPAAGCGCLRRRLALVGALVAPLLAAAEPPTVTEPKTHTLFMGVDFSIEHDKQLYRVQDVEGGSFVIMVNGQTVRVPMDRDAGRCKIEPSLKLAEASANVTGLKGERAYTPGNDPTVNFQRGVAQAELQYADARYAQNLSSDIQQNVASKQINTVGMSARDAPFSAQAQAAVKAQLLAGATASVNQADAGPGTDFQNKAGATGAEDAFDAMDVAFAVSAEQPLRHPYVVILVQYRARDSKPGQFENWVYAQALAPIGRSPTRVHVERGGFPPGFELRDFQVHLFNQGQEIASTVAPKRVALTREEAFQYVVVEYVGTHKNATLPPVPAMGALPPDLPARLARNELQQTYYVQVTKDGLATAAYDDASCTKRVEDAYLQSVVKTIRFKPALSAGRPVEGVAPLRLSQLPI